MDDVADPVARCGCGRVSMNQNWATPPAWPGGDSVTSNFAWLSRQNFEGTVSLVDQPSSMKRKRTRSSVRIDIPNPEIKLHPGMYVDVALEVEAGSGLVIPLNAVMPTGTRSIVFVDKGGDDAGAAGYKAGR